MAKMTVEEFVIELSLSDKITKGLTQLENKVKTASGRMEKNLNQTFGKDYTKPLRQQFDRLESHAKKTAQSINKSFSGIGKNQVNGRKMFSNVRSEAVKAARDAQRALNGIRGNPPAGGGRPPRGGGSGRPTLTPQERAFNRFSSSAGFRNLQNMGGGAAVRAREIQSALSSHLNRSGTSQGNVNAILTRYQSQLQAETQRLRATLQNSSRALQSHTGTVNDSAHGLAGLAAGLISVHAALEVFRASLEAGLNRQSANTSADFVFSKYGENAPGDAKKFAADMADQLGLSFNDTLSKMTGFVASAAPSMGVGNAKDFFSTSTTFGRLMGLNDEKMGRAQVALEQMASKGTVSAEELKGQLAEAMPGSMELFAKAYTGSDSAEGVAKLLADMKNGAVKAAPLLAKVNEEMKRQIEASGGLEKISHMTATAIGREKNAQEGWLVSLEGGFDSGFQHLLNSLTEFFGNTGELSYLLGEGLGFIFDTVGDLTDTLGTFFMHVNGWLLKLEAWYDTLDEPTQSLIKKGGELVGIFGQFLVLFTGFRAALAGLNLLLGGGALAKVIRLLAGGGGAAVAGGEVAAGGALAAGAAAAPVAIAGGFAASSLWDWLNLSNVGKETSNGGNTVKGSLAEKVWNGMKDAPMFNGNWTGAVDPASIPGVIPQAQQQQPITQDAITSGVAGAIKQGAIKLDLTVNGKAQSFNVKPYEEGQNHMSAFMDIDYSIESPYATGGG